MPRARTGAARHRRKVRLLKAAKGYRGGRSKLYRTAADAVTRAGVYAYRDRRQRRRQFRSLWVIRLSAACKERGMAYSRFIYGLHAAKVALNRKMLSEMAIHDPEAFNAVFELAKQHAAKIAA
ncbi:MAG TPA: 50S ribosomal protein L20 [Phycisphaerae bacterium]|nr:50S ribosomal protein L20 [Phycisphaerales bacterium]HRX86670.1 50S ribosomal protein L20 [Phycisphaerae bacterium]